MKVQPVVFRFADGAVSLDADAPFDYVLVCFKALLTISSTAELIKPAISAKTTIVLIQNGIATEQPSSNTESAARFAALLNAGGASTRVHEDVQFERWSKPLVNACWNPVCALARSRDAQILKSSPEAKDFIREVMLEIATVANICCYPAIDFSLVEHQLGRAAVRKMA